MVVTRHRCSEHINGVQQPTKNEMPKKPMSFIKKMTMSSMAFSQLKGQLMKSRPYRFRLHLLLGHLQIAGLFGHQVHPATGLVFIISGFRHHTGQ